MNVSCYDENDVQGSMSANHSMKKQGGSRAPLSSLDGNSSFKNATSLKKKVTSFLTVEKNHEMKKKNSQTFTKVSNTQKKIMASQKKEERENMQESIETSQRVFRTCYNEEDDFWTEEMETLLTLNHANPVYDSDSGDEYDDNDLQVYSTNDRDLYDESRLESRLTYKSSSEES
jgi:hypothetical protein